MDRAWGDRGVRSAPFVCGGWEGQEPEECADIFAPFLRGQGYEVEVSRTLDSYRDGDKLGSLDLVVQAWSMGEITDEQERGGLADSFRNNANFQFMVGGQVVAHPGSTVEYEVNIAGSEDPITAGLERFRVRSELYYLHVDPHIGVLATTTFTGEHTPWIERTVVPVVWKKRWGEGKVFYCLLGHVKADFDVPEVRRIVERGMLWASRWGKLPFGGRCSEAQRRRDELP
jgi:uncharacterized protein